MHEIYLVCTLHKENGNCNTTELLAIIEKIKPEIIFLELTKSDYVKFQNGEVNTVEVIAINKYKRKNNIKLIPVDNKQMSVTYHLLVDNMNKKIYAISNEYKRALSIFEVLVSQNGFNFLNSELCEEHFERLDKIENEAVKKMNSIELTKIYRQTKEIHNERENEMIKSIYEYSKKNHFNKGIFFIGAWHRKAIKRKILEYNKNEEIKLNWLFWPNKGKG